MTTTFTLMTGQTFDTLQQAKAAAVYAVRDGAPVAQVYDEEGRLAVTVSRGAQGMVTTAVCVVHEGPYVLRSWEVS